MPSRNWTSQLVLNEKKHRRASTLTFLERPPSRKASSTPKSTPAFLDLPAEIRLQIYEALFCPTTPVVLQSSETSPGMIAVLANFPDLISRGSRDVQLFRTCRTIHAEAVPIFYASVNLLVYQHLPLLRFNFLPHIGAFNASFIRRAIVTPIGLPGEHQRLLECIGARHGGLVGLESLTLEIWNPEHIPALITTCQELLQHHAKLRVLFGRGVDVEAELQAGDIPATLKLGKLGQGPGYRVRDQLPSNLTWHLGYTDPIGWQERTIEANVVATPEPQPECGDDCESLGPLTWKGRRRLSLAVPEPKRTIWSRYKTLRSKRRRDGSSS
jgi:hypothetical protein